DSNFDPATFRLNGFGFRNFVFDVPGGLTNYTARVNTAAEIGVDVNVTFGLDVTSNELFWAIQSVDPATGLPPMDAMAGFLPVNDSTAVGEGFVSYSIKAAPETVTGDEIRASANIFFDTNAPIPTNEVVNTIDAFAPTPQELTDISIQYDSHISFTVFGQDDPGGSGMKDFEVWVSEDGSEFRLVSTDNQVGETFTFQGAPGKNYCLVTVLRDNVNNRTLLSDYEPVCFTTPEVEARLSGFYSLQTEVSGQGTIHILPDAVAFSEGQVVVVKAIPSSGWGFESWEGDLTGCDAEINLVMDGNKSIRANFVANDVETGTFTVTVTGMPENIIVDNDPGVCGAEVAWIAPTPADNCQGHSIEQTAGLESGSVFPVGTTTITYTATDAYGNTAEASFTVTVNDTQAPVISGMPEDIVVDNNEGECGAVVTWQAPTAEDNCSVESFTNDIPENDFFPVGTTTITYMATDASGNTAEASFTVTVNDTQSPVISGMPEDIVVNNNEGECGAVVTWVAPTAEDNCSVESFTNDIPENDFFPVGTTNVTYTAVDAAGNTVSETFTITVTDNDTPEALARDITIQLNEDQSVTVSPQDLDNGSYDQCGTVTLSISKDTFTFADEGENYVVLTVTDEAGNQATAIAIVNVIVNRDTACEVFAIAKNIILALDKNGTAVLKEKDANDGSYSTCKGKLNLSVSQSLFTCEDIGENKIVLTATDSEGYSASVSFVATVVDQTAPVIDRTPKRITVAIAPDETYILPDFREQYNATDNCGMAEYEQIPAFGTVWGEPGNYLIQLKATDLSGNVNLTEITIVLTVSEPKGNNKEKGIKSAEITKTEIISGIDFMLYPNPTSGMVHIDISGEKIQPVKVTVLNMAGARVLQKEFMAGDNITFDMSEHISGMYLVRIETNDFETIKKLVLDRR
ncbi:MAG: HYR domain-containing protein, partial [Mariniphaga sp.]|nr:HYR domain-containing protein [Mariniphaga sp.]